jgi:hypothetical protein
MRQQPECTPLSHACLQESLFSQLQALPTLASMPPSAHPSHYVLPGSDSRRMAAARQVTGKLGGLQHGWRCA